MLTYECSACKHVCEVPDDNAFPGRTVKCPRCKTKSTIKAPTDEIPGWGSPLSAELPNTVTTQTQSENWLSQALTYLVVCLFLGGCFVVCNHSPTKNDNRANDNSDDVMAHIMAKQFVEQRLVSPGTASYGSWLENLADEDTVKRLGNGKYRVTGWVDSQNRFGATLRTHFVVEVQQMGGDKWRLLDITMREQ